MPYHILIIDDEPVSRELLAHAVQNRLGYRTSFCDSPKEASRRFDTEHSSSPDLILLNWPKNNAATIADVKSLSLQAPVITLVKYGDYDSAMTALTAGAQDFLTKPAAMERLGTTFRNALMLRDARQEVERLRRDRMRDVGVLHNAYDGGISIHYKLLSEDGNIRRMDDIEAECIRFAMQHYHGRMTEVARRLGIGRSTLYRKLGEIGVDRQPTRAAEQEQTESYG